MCSPFSECGERCLVVYTEKGQKGSTHDHIEPGDFERVTVFAAIASARAMYALSQNDPANVLNRKVAAVEWTNLGVADALDKTMSLVTGVPYHTPAPTPDDRRFDVALPKGTILQLLNAIASNHGELIWHVSYRSRDTGAKFGVGFKTFSGHAKWIWIPELPERRRSDALSGG